MTAPLWVEELAGTFWREAGFVEGFPRSLRAAVDLSTFELTLKDRPDLSIDGVENYLAHQGTSWRCGEADRPLHACLVAIHGHGWIFLDAGDSPRERVYSLAHELGHFLRHYWQRRQRAVAALGPPIVEVLDGRREPRPGERLHALLRGVPVGVHSHLMHRDKVLVPPAVAQAEAEADRLAWELLAPEAEVLVRLGTRADRERAAAVLVEEFGLPAGPAGEYAGVLFPAEEDSPVVLNLKNLLKARREGAK
jgi:hypothetical protein